MSQTKARYTVKVSRASFFRGEASRPIQQTIQQDRHWARHGTRLEVDPAGSPLGRPRGTINL
ncbi:MAG: hypothetical protein WC666_00655 [Candidatus Paceibacterota bacterium]|jgi:hypothetical protein